MFNAQNLKRNLLLLSNNRVQVMNETENPWSLISRNHKMLETCLKQPINYSKLTTLFAFD